MEIQLFSKFSDLMVYLPIERPFRICCVSLVRNFSSYSPSLSFAFITGSAPLYKKQNADQASIRVS